MWKWPRPDPVLRLQRKASRLRIKATAIYVFSTDWWVSEVRGVAMRARADGLRAEAAALDRWAMSHASTETVAKP